jgi:hypothetical protein
LEVLETTSPTEKREMLEKFQQSNSWNRTNEQTTHIATPGQEEIMSDIADWAK